MPEIKTALMILLGGILSVPAPAAPNLDLNPVSPQLREDVEQKTRPGLPRQSLIMPFVIGSELSVYAVPFDRWCSNHPNDNLEGRLTVNFNYPRKADGTSVSARLLIDTGLSGGYSQDIRLGSGRFTVTSNVFTLSARSVCSDSCTTFRIRPTTPTDSHRVSSGPYRACIR